MLRKVIKGKQIEQKTFAYVSLCAMPKGRKKKLFEIVTKYVLGEIILHVVNTIVWFFLLSLVYKQI